MKRLAVLLLAIAAVFYIVPAASATSTPTLTAIRTGRHTGFDRVVLDLNGNRPEFFVNEVDQLYDCGPGNPVSVPGNGFLEVRLAPAAAHDDAGNPTYTGPRNFPTPALANVRGVALTCDFEANLTVGLGYANANSWHRVFLLDNPTRVVIDIGL
ncbi:hypothetical protein Lesp02_34470 [Lentzea sp. NBRC 105346]|uniref:AMIN-like domain-containing (lipo)protein n=1 Tax=Lentzea sp. NBRC 105346 TaxID=3032205 RepID=UPI0024A3820F|nr:hypothetical protein [Lentzea sp. NBRC 105346]GLZ31259.1 hypothetical protein Lesp02_34470 [Lentzea sp. NBRC 105346]